MAASPASAAPAAAMPGPAATLASDATAPALPPAPLPAVADLVTVVLTTSPTPSAPSTELVDAVLASFRTHCPALLACPVTVVFDTYDRIGPRSRLKRGSVTPAEAAHYAAYKENVRRLVKGVWEAEGKARAAGGSATVDTVETGAAEYGSPFLADNSVPFTITRTGTNGRIAFIEPAARLGFALAVRTAVRAASTPYVWVQQHDWTLAADVPLAAMLDVMCTAEAELTGGTPTEDAGLSTGGQPAVDGPVALPVRYIGLPSIRMLQYAVSDHVVRFPSLRLLTETCKRQFPCPSSSSARVSTDNAAAAAADDDGGPAHRLPLTPLFLWHDKPHLALAAHYLARIFPSRLAVARGDFIEDHIGQRARAQMKRDPALWRKWACWLYYPDEGRQLCLRHLQGRTWRGEADEAAARDAYRKRNRAAAAAAAAAVSAGGNKNGGAEDEDEIGDDDNDDDNDDEEAYTTADNK
ncbi:hypothetical protein SPI_03778 [Niveomyces insectorum RCEF 264]|uniref:Uncharacterized protein n=1 Tax=Niveomyces insectorum RCEF 264 TaxID=1081102 RepID=A0A167WCM8_9HYPO|nr:hypothetical protein SPI_03778 [Niveomyces insectorum RCEF 264]